MKSLTKCDGLKAFIAPNVKNIITYIYNIVKEELYEEIGIHYLYSNLYIIVNLTTLTYSGSYYHYIGLGNNTD